MTALAPSHLLEFPAPRPLRGADAGPRDRCRQPGGGGVHAGGGGLDVELWAADTSRYAAGLYLVPAERRVLLPTASSPEFADRLLMVCRALAIDVIVPTLDGELLPVSSDPALALPLRDRRARPERSCARDLPRPLAPDRGVPEGGHRGSTGLDCLDRPMALRGFERPFAIKRRLHSGARDSTVVGEHSVAPIVRFDGSHILQEYLTGDEYSIDVLAYGDGHVAAVVPRSRRRSHSGIAIAGSTLLDPQLDRLGRRVAEALGLTAVASVKVRRDTAGEPKVIDVCPRIPSGMPLTIASGVNMPALALGDVLGKPGPRSVEHRQVSMVHYWDQQFVETSELEHWQVPETVSRG